MSTYAWTIDRVNVAELGDDMAEEKGIKGPRNASPELLAELAAGGGHTFRMLDDDGIWYYRGRIAFDTPARPAGRLVTMNPGEEPRWIECGTVGDEGFGPLEDFGTPNAGCTEIQYRVTVALGDKGATGRVWATL